MLAMTRNRSAICAAAAALLGCCLPLLLVPSGWARAAEQTQPWRLEEELPLPERLSLTGTFRLRYEYLDNQFRAGRPGSDEILALRTLLHARFRFTDWLSVGAEFEDSRAYLADSNTPVDVTLVNAAELLRAYCELNFDGPFGGTHRAQLGRMTLDVGSRRLVARNRFRNTVNAFTGLDWSWRNDRGRELRAFFTLPVQRLPRDEESLRDNEIKFDQESVDFKFWGLFYADALPWGDLGNLYLFGLHEQGTLEDIAGSPPTRNRQLFTPGFHLLRAPEEGRFDYEIETALQFGTARASASATETLDAFAHFHLVKLGYTFARPWSPRLILHYDYGSGDRDPTDGRWGRFDTLFGARRFEFGPTSLYGAFTRSNVNTPGLRLEVKPAPKWSAFVAYRAVWLASSRDEWVPTGVRDPAGDSGRFVGQQIEMRTQWRPLPGNLLLEFGYTHLFAGEFIDDAPNSNGGDTNYVYTQFVLGF
jgi:hypothetical protein